MESMNNKYGELLDLSSFSPDAMLNATAVRNSCKRNFMQAGMELCREIISGGGYIWRGITLPRRANIVIPARGSYEEQLSVPAGSFLTGIRSYNSAVGSDFKLQLFEYGSNRFVFNSECSGRCVSGNAQNDVTPTSFMSFMIPAPLVILKQSQLGVTIVNMASAAQTIEVFLTFAVPSGRKQ